jgi:hypothetical protein
MLFQAQFLMAPVYATPISFRASNNQVGVNSGAGDVANAPKPAGIAVGDLVTVSVVSVGGAPSLTTTSGSAWGKITLTNTTTPRNYALYWKVLTATDVSNTWVFGAGVDGAFSAAYVGNGATTVTLKETVVNPISQSSLSFVGYTPSLDSRGSISAMYDIDTDATDTAPSGWTRRDFTKYPTGGATQKLAYADNLGSYPGGALTWSATLGGSGFSEAAILLDVT